MCRPLSQKEMNDRLDRLLDKLEPVFDSEKLCSVKLSAEDVAALLIISFAFARAAPAREDFTDEELTELERHADRIVKICPVEAGFSPVESV